MSRQGIMLATPYDLNRFKRWGENGFIQPKLNGERCRAYIDDFGKCHLKSSENNVIISVPHINKALEALPFRGVELDGELYTHGMDFDDIRSRVARTVNMHPDYGSIGYHIFDLVADNTQRIRVKDLLYIKDKFKPPLYYVEGYEIVTYREMTEAYERFMDQGYEGFILRNMHAKYERKRVTTMMKHKPREQDEFKILGVKEEIDKYGKPKDRAGAIELQGELGTFTAAGMTDEEKEFFWKHKDFVIGRKAVIEYQYLTAKRGVPRHPIFIKAI